MHEREPIDCNDLISYLTGEGSEFERAAFEKHLRSCASCRDELKELQAVWNALPFQMDAAEVPPDLKSDVMAAIDKLDQEVAVQQQRANKRSFPFPWVTGLACAIAVGIIIGVFGNQAVTRQSVPATTVQSEAPAELLKTLDLKAADSTMPLAKGRAWVMKQGDSRHIVIQLEGLKETEGDSAYQAWLIKNGKRYNCGTFYVGENGTGVLTYEMDARYTEFDAIGVTLEPDANGKQPRGNKVLGT